MIDDCFSFSILSAVICLIITQYSFDPIKKDWWFMNFFFNLVRYTFLIYYPLTPLKKIDESFQSYQKALIFIFNFYLYTCVGLVWLAIPPKKWEIIHRWPISSTNHPLTIDWWPNSPVYHRFCPKIMHFGPILPQKGLKRA